MIRHLLSVLCIGLVVGFALPANADIELGVESSIGNSIAPGDSGLLTFFVTASGGELGDDANAYIVTMDTAAINGASLSDLTLGLASVTAPMGGFVLQSQVGSTFEFQGSGIPSPMNPRLDLFIMPFSIAGSAADVGSFTFDVVDRTEIILNGSSLSGVTFAQSPEATLAFSSQIPEPTAMGLLFAGLVGIATTRRRRKLA